MFEKEAIEFAASIPFTFETDTVQRIVRAFCEETYKIACERGQVKGKEDAKEIINELLMNGYDESTRRKALDFLYPDKEEQIMFEQKAKEYANEWLFYVKDLELQHKEDDKPEYIRIMQAHSDGAIFGYTKGKEEAEAWCYPSKGQFPEREMHCLVQWQDESISDIYFAIDGNGEAYLVGSKRFPKEIVAWKEIIPPKRPLNE